MGEEGGVRPGGPWGGPREGFGGLGWEGCGRTPVPILPVDPFFWTLFCLFYLFSQESGSGSSSASEAGSEETGNSADNLMALLNNVNRDVAWLGSWMI